MNIQDFNIALNMSCLAYNKQGGAFSADTGDKNKGGIYVKPVDKTQKQEDTIQKAVNELSKVKFSALDIMYVKALGVNLPYRSGQEAVKFLKDKNAEISYAKFSNPNVHACLDTTQTKPVILINSEYKDLASKTDVLAISEALLHEAGHAKDGDSLNSIQEELDCLALNVLAHQYYKRKNPNVFEGQKSPLYSEGVSLYDKLFFDYDISKKALKKRVADKYGYLDVYSPNHKPSKMAAEIKEIFKQT